MLQSKLFLKTFKEKPKDEDSINAQLLIRAGFIEKNSAGIYNFLPLGFLMLQKISEIVRKHLRKIGAQELLLSALHPKENWQKTGRWKKFDALYQLKSRTGTEFALGPTHEEVIFPLVQKRINSYKDLPFALFQMQTKFRDELRPKAGLLRGREFLMKDLYSFHSDFTDLKKYKERVDKEYLAIFKEMGLKVLMTKAGGGTFSDYSTEFQVLTESGEDSIYICEKCLFSINQEIQKSSLCPQCQTEMIARKSIEVGNTFELGDKFSKPFNVVFKDKKGETRFVLAGCYGLGLSRTMGAIAEVSHDEKGLILPPKVAPYLFHLILLVSEPQKTLRKLKFVNENKEENFWLIDDRHQVSFGEKLAESDLIGMPFRMVISEKTLKKNSFELKERRKTEVKIYKIKDLPKIIEKLKKE